MTAQEVMADIEREFESYRADSISNGAEDVWDNSFRVNAWCCIKGYFDNNELSDEDMDRLHRISGGCIISSLVDWYIDCEEYDIANDSDVGRLVKDYLYECGCIE